MLRHLYIDLLLRQKNEQMNSQLSHPKKKGYNEDIVERFRRKLDLIFEYKGLVNQGATCYLNSVLQVLFMTKSFREAVESHSGKNPKTVDFQLKSLFKTLKTKETNIKDILPTLSIVNVHEQRDAAEYLEKLLSMVNPDWSKMFKGQFRHTTRCSKGHEVSDVTGPFWTLPLSLAHSSDKSCSVMEGLEELFKSSIVSEMYCDQCEERTHATIAGEMVEPPEILTLLLKRFEFDYRRRSYVKKDCSVDVPHTLQIKDCDYELYAVVDHVGSLRGGHYTATIRSYEDHNWYVFDDTYVRLASQQSTSHVDNERSQSPYLLMYQKDQPRKEEIERIMELKCMEEDWKNIEEKLKIIKEQCKRMNEKLMEIINMESKSISVQQERVHVESKTCEDSSRSGEKASHHANCCPMTTEKKKGLKENIREIEKSRREIEKYKRRFEVHRNGIGQYGRQSEEYRKGIQKNRRAIEECRKGIHECKRKLVKCKRVIEHMAELGPDRLPVGMKEMT
ncbi:ubiquitin carboxyl-terminal hydrolase 47 isoform X2 [Esox lucius]|nr:ubiquitin carboxyl-terminal hydrolase 47 isoform X2 [Esox lucius]